MDGGAKGAADGKYAERACGIYDDFDHFFMDNLKQIFGLVYSDTPTESYEESEEYEDWRLCAKAQPAFIKAFGRFLPLTSEGHRTLLCCAARFPVSAFSFGAQRAISRTSHKIAFAQEICPPGARPGGKRFYLFDRLGRAPFRCPPFAFVRLHAGKRPPTCLSRPCGETLRFPKKIRPETCFDTVKNGSASKLSQKKG